MQKLTKILIRTIKYLSSFTIIHPHCCCHLSYIYESQQYLSSLCCPMIILNFKSADISYSLCSDFHFQILFMISIFLTSLVKPPILSPTFLTTGISTIPLSSPFAFFFKTLSSYMLRTTLCAL